MKQRYYLSEKKGDYISVRQILNNIDYYDYVIEKVMKKNNMTYIQAQKFMKKHIDKNIDEFI